MASTTDAFVLQRLAAGRAARDMGLELGPVVAQELAVEVGGDVPAEGVAGRHPARPSGAAGRRERGPAPPGSENTDPARAWRKQGARPREPAHDRARGAAHDLRHFLIAEAFHAAQDHDLAEGLGQGVEGGAQLVAQLALVEGALGIGQRARRAPPARLSTSPTASGRRRFRSFFQMLPRMVKSQPRRFSSGAAFRAAARART